MTKQSSAATTRSGAHEFRPVTMRNGDIACGDCWAPPSHPIHHVGDSSVLDAYPDHTAVIWFKDGNGVKDWFIGAEPETDNESTLREHLRRNLPAAEFLGCAIK